MRIIKAQKNQSLFDISLQEYGDVTGVLWLLEDNMESQHPEITDAWKPLLSIVDTLDIGQELQIRESTINSLMQNYLRQYTIATAEGTQATGIGFWIIEEDFVVS